MNEEKPNYYAIIPSNVRYDSRLKPNEKLLYSEITALSNKTGLCYATNKYFAELYEVELETISRWIKNLKDFGYISTEIQYKKDTKEIEKRVIKIHGIPIDKKINTYCLNNQEGIDEKVKENNTSINKKKIYKRKDFIPPTLEEIRIYCLERKNSIVAEQFYDYYSVSGWRDKDGKPIKNWKQRIISWEGRNKTAGDKTQIVPSKGFKPFEMTTFPNGLKGYYDDKGNIHYEK